MAAAAACREHQMTPFSWILSDSLRPTRPLHRLPGSQSVTLQLPHALTAPLACTASAPFAEGERGVTAAAAAAETTTMPSLEPGPQW